MEVATELSLSTIQMAETAFPAGEPANEILREMSVSPFTEAAKALHALIILDTTSMRSPQSITVLGGKFSDLFERKMKFSLIYLPLQELGKQHTVPAIVPEY